MTTLKISQLTPIAPLNSNTANVVFVATDTQSGVSGKISAHTLATGLYANNILNVGNNAVTLPNTVAQFSAAGDSYVQTNLVNTNDGGSADIVVTANTGTDSTYFIDVGYANKDYEAGSEFNNIGTAVNRLDGYIYAQGSTGNTWGGNLIVGSTTTGKEIRFIAGGGTVSNVVARMNSSAIILNQPLVYPDGTTQNTAVGLSASTYANGAFIQANAAFLKANTPGYTSNSAALYANGAFIQANAAFLKANTPGYVSNSAALYANGAFIQANSAYDKANNALANTTGIFGGDLTIAGKANVLQQIVVSNSTYDYTNTALMRIVGSEGAIVQPPANPGYMLSITGVDGISSRLINSSYGTGAYALFAGRKGNGTAGTPTAVANNNVIARFSGSGYNGSAFTTTGQVRIDFVADEDFTTANNGSRIEFYNTIQKTNTVTKIATFNSNTVTFTGEVNPQKGFAYTPNNITSNSTSYTLDFNRDSMTRMTVNDNMTITLSNYVQGKILEVWITNMANQNKTITHGCLANNSTAKSTSFTIQANACAFLKYFSIDGDNANTFVSITA